MKKFLFISSAALFVLVSCTSKTKSENAGGMSDRANKNLDAMHIVENAIMTGDISKLDSAVADNFVDHTSMGDMNKDSLKSMAKTMHEKEPNSKMERKLELANDDYAMIWYRFTGTGDGSMGMPAGPYDFNAVELVKFDNNSKAVEHWEYMDPAAMMKMMKSMPTNMPPAGMGDTTKHM
jgi:predicted SnoaL-like aldol condensation-catalyzing enzyme